MSISGAGAECGPGAFCAGDRFGPMVTGGGGGGYACIAWKSDGWATRRPEG